MKYIQHGFTLSELHKKRIQQHIEQKSSLSLRLSLSNLSGNDILLITPTIQKQIQKAIAAKKGLQIRFSLPMLKASLKGGFLGQALAILAPIQKAVGSLVTPEFEDRINRYLAGNGLQDKSDAFKQGIQMALTQQPKGGDLGNDIAQFFQGVFYGFSNPLKGLQVLGKAITGKGTQHGSGVKFY